MNLLSAWVSICYSNGNIWICLILWSVQISTLGIGMIIWRCSIFFVHFNTGFILSSADYVFEQRNQQVFALLPFDGGFHDAPRMDCNENMAPSCSNIHLNSSFQIAQNQSGFNKVYDNSSDVDCTGDRGHLGEINQNRAEAYSCIRFKDPPVKCVNFMSHYVWDLYLDTTISACLQGGYFYWSRVGSTLFCNLHNCYAL